MSIIHLEYNLLGQTLKVMVLLVELLNRQLHACGYEEVLLLQTQLLAGVMVVVGIQNLGDGLRDVLLLNCLTGGLWFNLQKRFNTDAENSNP